MRRPSTPNLLLILAGGGTDAVVILGFNILTAAQTGNTILFAVALAKGDFITGFNSGISILCFVAGAVCVGVLCRRSRAPFAFAGEIVFLLGALGLWLWGERADGVITASADGGWIVYGVVGLAAAAMGMQSALTAHMHGEPGTFVTGLLTQFATMLGAPTGENQTSAATRGLVWVLYFGGALFSGLLFLAVGPWTLLLPAACVLGAWLRLLPSR
jgi:uncharacterized membrane protein YoaK (UPF0700 family)